MLADPKITPTAKLHSSFNRGKALVVDDEKTNRLVLKALLENIGFQVIEAENGATAVELFSRDHPDIIFMDIMMPVMDGYEATEKIKALCGTTFIPVIFVTALTDHKSMIAAIRSGGDDFFVKPFNVVTLETKILAMERLRDLYRTTAGLYERVQQDQKFAEILFSEAITSNNVALDTIQMLMQPASTFNGDMLLTEHSMSSDLHVMLGDFTGHGLAAALGAFPTSEVFRAMCRKGFSMPKILASINRKLHSFLPKGMFLAIQYVSISNDLKYVNAVNCAMPDILILDGNTGQIKSRITSTSFPLGVVPDIDYKPLLQQVSIQPGDRIVLASDGVSEAQNTKGEFFEQHRFEETITKSHDGQLVASLNKALNDFCRNTSQTDDISMVEVPCIRDILPTIEVPPPEITEIVVKPNQAPDNQPVRSSWQYQLQLDGSKLRTVNPVPIIIAQLQEFEDIGTHCQNIYTILTELYVNALDHGLLELDSSLKQSPAGLTQYFNEREKRLKNLQDGWINLCLNIEHSETAGRVKIRIEDSGGGFDFSSHTTLDDNNEQLHGRGIVLIQDLSESLNFQVPGNKVDVVYAWKE